MPSRSKCSSRGTTYLRELTSRSRASATVIVPCSANHSRTNSRARSTADAANTMPATSMSAPSRHARVSAASPSAGGANGDDGEDVHQLDGLGRLRDRNLPQRRAAIRDPRRARRHRRERRGGGSRRRLDGSPTWRARLRLRRGPGHTLGSASWRPPRRRRGRRRPWWRSPRAPRRSRARRRPRPRGRSVGGRPPLRPAHDR